MSDHPIIGVLGGMGPEATVDLMRRVIAATPAEDDADHIHMIVDNNPKVPSRQKALVDGTGASPGPVLAAMAASLEAAGAQAIVMPCNTAHVYQTDIEAAIAVPMISMVSLASARLAEWQPRPARVGLLATRAVHQTGLYSRHLAEHGIEVLAPERQDDLTEVILAVKRGDNPAAVGQTFDTIAGELAHNGVDALLVACTELSVLIRYLNQDIVVLDALDVLSEAIVDFGTSGSHQPRAAAPQS